MFLSRISFLEILKINNKERKGVFEYRAITFFGFSFQRDSSNQPSPKYSPSGTKHIKNYVLGSRRYFLTTPIFSCEKIGLGCFPFRSPLLRELTSFSFPLGTEMFHFPRFARIAKQCVALFIAVQGYPIRKSPDQRLLATSPRLIADTPRPSSPQSPKASTICL